MRYIKGGVLLLAAVGAFSAAAANAQSRTAPSAWNDPYSGRTENQQAIDLAIAEAQRREREGGYGPSSSTTNIGTYTSNTTNNGPVSTSGSTNIVNSNSTSSTVTGSTGITLTVTTGQTAGPSTQGATSAVVTGNGNNTDLGIVK